MQLAIFYSFIHSIFYLESGVSSIIIVFTLNDISGDLMKAHKLTAAALCHSCIILEVTHTNSVKPLMMIWTFMKENVNLSSVHMLTVRELFLSICD